jgi:arylsulfatase A-like enzyme
MEAASAQRTYASETRKEYCGLVYGLDETLGGLVQQLRDNGLWDSTYLIFFSDNGAAPNDGSAYPFRGVKKTLFEGGIRSQTFVSGGMLPTSMRGQTLTSTIHVTDWFNTICSFAKVDCNSYDLDGIDLSDYITKGIAPTRDYLLLNVDMDSCESSYNGSTVCGAIRYNEWKLAIGNQIDGSTEDYFWDVNYIENPSIDYSTAIVKCSGEEPTLNMSNNCALQKTVCLFNIEDDPCEYRDLSDEYPSIVDQLMEELQYYYNIQETPVQLTSKGNSTGSDPSLFNGFWTPWRHSAMDGAPYKQNDVGTKEKESGFFNMIVSILM